MKDKKGITITKAFQEILYESGRSPNKIWVDDDSEFYNRSIKSWLQDNGMEMYSTHSEGKSVVAVIFSRTLKNKICECMTSKSKDVYIDKLVDIANNYNNTYHSTIKMKPVDVKSSTYIDFDKENNKESPNIKSKYRNIKSFLKKVRFQIRVKKFLLLKKLKKLFREHMFMELNGAKVVGKF